MTEENLAESPSYTIASLPYVRVPLSFRDKYPGWRNTQPEVLLSRIDDIGKVRLVYEWNESDILEVKQ